MADDFRYDVFLSHSSKDKAVVRSIAERLRADGLRVWFDEWELQPGDHIPAKIEEGLEHSRVLVLCMSAHAFGSVWAQLEAKTFRFHDPLNKERRFISLRLDKTPVKGSLAHFLYIDWPADPESHEKAYANLLEACLPPAKQLTVQAHAKSERISSDLTLIQYMNAKVLFVGESGVGKTGLCMRLALNDWLPSDSTVGTWSTQWKLPVSSVDGGHGCEREIQLWDLGGQGDQRLMHQLYMEDAALVVFVFDGQKEDLFETLSQWDRDLTRASRQAFTKLLVAGRADAGGLLVKRSQIEAFAKERGFAQFIETSAKTGLGCNELKQAILDGIRWEKIPWRSFSLTFKRLKEEIVCLKDAGLVLTRFNELREALRLRLPSEVVRFTDEELRAVIGLLAVHGIVWELAFGSWVLLQPEQINNYAQAVIHTLWADDQEYGAISEERVLNGLLIYPSWMQRLEAEEERFVLLALLQTLVERGLCLREHTDNGAILVFPSYFRRKRPELIGHPPVLVSYRFSGFLDDIYATLIVRLCHTKSFRQDQLWHYAADFRTLAGKRLGMKLIRRAEDAGELKVYFDPTISMEEKITFSQYVHDHLLQKGQGVVRLRHYVCPHCGTPVGNLEVAMKKLEEGKKDIPCINCDSRIPLWDQMEELSASPEIKRRVRELQELSAIILDNESKERALVGEVISTVALAGQICREFVTSDFGIDMEIEFRDDAGQATGKKLYLQIKAVDSRLTKRRSDGAEVFTIKSSRHAHYWMAQPFPIMLVTRTANGEIRWMEIRDWLKRISDDGKKIVKQIVFEGERFDVMSVRRWRDLTLQWSQKSLTKEMVEHPDAEVRRSSIEGLTTSMADDITRHLLVQRGIDDSDEGIRCLIVKKLAALWPDNNTCDFLRRVAKKDTSGEVRIKSCEELARLWWKELRVRRFLRSRIEAESDADIRQRLIRTIESVGTQLSDLWAEKLSGKDSTENEPESLPGYPAFRVSRFRLRDIGPFRDTEEVKLEKDVNIFLGDNATGKTTILRCLALAAIGPTAANEVEDNPSAYLRKGAQCGTIEVLFEVVPDPDLPPTELGCFSVGLQITAGSSRFAPIPNTDMTLLPTRSSGEQLLNSARYLGALRTDWSSQFGFISGYGALRAFGESRFAVQTELKKRENEWVLSLFKPEAWLVNPEVFSRLIRGDTSNIEEAPHKGLSKELIDSLQTSLKHLFPEVKTFFGEGESDLQLNGTPLRFGELSDGYRSLFALIGHLLRCSLKVRDWKGDPTQIDGIALIDEMDLHLHPAWQYHVVKDFQKAFPNLQLIASTHAPLVIGALERKNVLIMRREEGGTVTIDRPEFDPQGQGVAGILTSVFDLSSTIDQPTLDKITHRLLLHANRQNWDEKDKLEYKQLTDELATLGFSREFSDPYFERFATAMARRYEASLEQLTPQQKLELDAYSDKLLDDIMNEDSK